MSGTAGNRRLPSVEYAPRIAREASKPRMRKTASELEERADVLLKSAAVMEGEAMRLYARAALLREMSQ